MSKAKIAIVPSARVAQWIAARCEPWGWVKSSVAYSDYVEWFRGESADDILSAHDFYGQVKALGYKTIWGSDYIGRFALLSLRPTP